MKLVDDVRDWWRWGSTYVYLVLMAFPTVWLMSPDLQALLPPKVVSAVAPFVAALGFFLRIRKQVRKEDKPDDTDKAGA